MRIVGNESCLFPSVMMAGVIAANDALDLPPSQIVKELTTRETYLAHEELIQFVDAGQFFGFSSPSVSSAGGSGLFFFSISGIGKKSADMMMISFDADMIPFMSSNER